MSRVLGRVMLGVPHAHMTDVERAKTSALEMMTLLYRGRTGSGAAITIGGLPMAVRLRTPSQHRPD